ncbi:MAG: hypothetical protein LBR28_04070 [Bacteroidales bacterium]|jgi:DNA polymerase-3 subunit delta'|nr:hypothetical protein [Bacteroidales bacterium]
MQFANIIGQNKLINSLIKIVQDQRVSHTQLFFGQFGSGTFALALAYAQFINCTNKQYFPYASGEELKADSCNTCPSCLKYNTLTHPDLHFCFPNVANEKLGIKQNPEAYLYLNLFREFVLKNDAYIDLESWYETIDVGNKQGVINVRDVARIINNLSLKAFEATFKVTIVWCFDKLHYDAAPKLLKILEEPDPNTLFFLITDNSDAILPTIISRTQLVKVPSLSTETIINYLETEKGLSEDVAKQQAIIAEGSLIKIRNIANTDNRFEEFIVEWTRNTFSIYKDISPIINMADEFAAWGREQQRLFFTMAINVFRKSMYINMGINNSNDFFEIKDDKFKTNFPKLINPNVCEKIYKLIEEADYHIQRNANPKILFLDLSIKTGEVISMRK